MFLLHNKLCKIKVSSILISLKRVIYANGLIVYTMYICFLYFYYAPYFHCCTILAQTGHYKSENNIGCDNTLSVRTYCRMFYFVK